MLVLSRRKDETIHIGPNVVVTVVSVVGNRVRLGISAPGDIKILRGELPDAQPRSETNDADPAGPANCEMHIAT